MEVLSTEYPPIVYQGLKPNVTDLNEGSVNVYVVFGSINKKFVDNISDLKLDTIPQPNPSCLLLNLYSYEYAISHNIFDNTSYS